ncbi:mRNA export protein mlo3 [Penicillium subrubescens]|uniref:mRNA export protein mlo3 n=1 Tax=Penicillium subrubescens TaxID=1316194 RepID=A0A1Q5UHY4_9EURO|nr:mRNA export protein mlo3 [Penicillium subrubescens]KAJ5900917.1 mRNA export protein mlo3 [Penicillium subrubescens]OKP12071.1 mRNA export protein mlo3 [Penicillium subrubescens]
MSANLDKSLDDLVGNRRQNARRRGAGRRPAAKPSVGGVKKSSKATKAAAKVVHPTPVAPTASSKIIVSGLPSDVSEANIKEYFAKSAGPVKRVMLTYNQNGTSRGIASIIFNKPDTALKAAKELNGLHVDGRPMKIEVVFDASHAPTVPAPKPLAERVVQKSQPKPATAAKPAANKAKARSGRGGARGGRGRNPGRGKPKTVEELDAEMVDYFSNENAPAAGNAPIAGAAPQAANGEDTGMAEIS